MKKRNKVLKALDKVLFTASGTATAALAAGSSVLAEGSGGGLQSDVGSILNDAQDTGVFSEINQKVKGAGTSAYNLVFAAISFVVVIGLLIALARLFLSNSATREESKSSIVWKIVAGIAIFGVVGIVNLVSAVSKGFFGDKNGGGQ